MSKDTTWTRPPIFRKGTIVSHGNRPRMQVLKIRKTESGQYECKIRYYNALFGAYWVHERELSSCW